MKLLQKTLVAAGVATAVLATGAAQAATINNPSTATVPAPGKAIVNESTRTVITPVATTVFLGAGEGLSVDDSITFTLNSGTWAAIASTDLTDAVGGVAGSGTFALVSGGAGTSAATFRVTTAIPIASNMTLATTANVTGTAIPDSTVITVQADMSGFVGGAQTALFGSPLVSLNTAMAPAMTAAFTATTGTFQVATGFTTLATGNTSTGATVTPTVNAAAAANVTTTGAPLGVPTSAATLITIAGPMTGVGAVSSANIQGSSAAGVATANTTTTFTIDAANSVATGTMLSNTAPATVAMTFDGTVSYAASAYTATVSLLADVTGGYAANASVGSGTVFTFGRNGSAFTTNSFGTLNKLTVTDRSGALGGTSGADGAITLTAYDAAGAVVTCTGLTTVTNIPNNGTTTITGADVTTACPGAKRIEGIVNSTSILVTNTKVAADGATSQSGLNGASTIAN